MKKNTIKKSLDKVGLNTQIVNKFDKFCTTERAEYLVRDINRLGMHDLLNKYGLQYLKKLRPLGSESAIRQFIRIRLYTQGVNHNYTHINNGKFIPRRDINFKLPWNLTKDEIKAIWKNRRTTLQYAERLHMLEEHKINKWENKHRPTFEELKQDLFPRTLIQGFLDLRDKKREIIREDLSAMYPPEKSCNVTVRFYSDNGTVINEKLFGHLYDPKNIMNSHPSFYTVQKKDKVIKNASEKLKEQAIRTYGDDFICLKVFCRGTNSVGMWI